MQHSFRRQQKGAASIEFAVIFMIFFMLFYGLVAFIFPLFMRATYEELAAEALREAITLRADGKHGDIEQRINETIARSWLPEAWRQPCTDSGGTFLITTADSQWKVCIGYDKVGQILPSLQINGRKFPPLPQQLSGEAVIRFAN